MDAQPTTIAGCYLVRGHLAEDERGQFHKPFSSRALAQVFPDRVAEIFWSTNRRGTIRGMHLQLPPHDHDKIVMCVTGAIHDVVVDLRFGPAYGSTVAVELSGDSDTAIVVPRGCAHGYQALTDDAVVLYATTTAHAPDSDTGVLYSTVYADWPLPVTRVSARDAGLPTSEQFRAVAVDPLTGTRSGA